MTVQSYRKHQSIIRLIFYPPSLGPGGSEMVILNLCRKVSRERFNIVVCAMTDGLFADEIRALGIPVIILAGPKVRSSLIVSKLVNYFRMLRTLKSITCDGTPTVVHTHHYGPLLQLFFLKKFTIKKFGWLHTEHGWTDVRNAYHLWLYKLLNPLKSPDTITGVTDKITSYMQVISGISKEKAVTVLNGIDTARFKPEIRVTKRCELGFRTSDVVIGTVGRLSPEKNQQLVIKAFALIATEMTDLHLVICGDGECRPELESLVVELGIVSRVNFLGFRLDAHEIMLAFDIYCLPSIYEGLSLSILEAWAAKKPIVATDVVGNKEIIKHEENGLLVPLNDEKLMAEVFMRLIHDTSLMSHLANHGYDMVIAKYEIHHMVNHYERLYEEIAHKI